MECQALTRCDCCTPYHEMGVERVTGRFVFNLCFVKFVGVVCSMVNTKDSGLNSKVYFKIIRGTFGYMQLVVRSEMRQFIFDAIVSVWLY